VVTRAINRELAEESVKQREEARGREGKKDEVLMLKWKTQAAEAADPSSERHKLSPAVLINECLNEVLDLGGYAEIPSEHRTLYELLVGVMKSDKLRKREAAVKKSDEEVERIENMNKQVQTDVIFTIANIRSQRAGGNRTSVSGRVGALVAGIYGIKSRAFDFLSSLKSTASRAWARNIIGLLAFFYIMCIMPALARACVACAVVCKNDNQNFKILNRQPEVAQRVMTSMDTICHALFIAPSTPPTVRAHFFFARPLFLRLSLSLFSNSAFLRSFPFVYVYFLTSHLPT
jgi:hypothetical protein